MEMGEMTGCKRIQPWQKTGQAEMTKQENE